MNFFNARIWTPWREVLGAVECANGRIRSVGSMEKLADAVDCQNLTLVPGFIDLHSHGGGGFDFMDGGDAIVNVARAHMRYGTTTILPTSVACPMGDLNAFVADFQKFSARPKQADLPDMPGLHLEGPYFAKAQRGAQDERYIYDPDPAEYLPILETGLVQRWSLAPELPGAVEMAAALKKHGVLISVGHTEALYDEMEQALALGFTHITHLYSGMNGVVRVNAFRHGGAVEASLLLDFTVELISDGCHLPDELLRLVYRMKGAKNICLVTDSMRVAGLDVTESILGNAESGQRVIIEDGVAKLPDRSAFAGSIATADRLVRTMIHAGICPREAVGMMTATPARIMNWKRKGRIAVGADADMVALDDQYQVKMVIKSGEVVVNNL